MILSVELEALINKMEGYPSESAKDAVNVLKRVKHELRELNTEINNKLDWIADQELTITRNLIDEDRLKAKILFLEERIEEFKIELHG